MPGINMSGGYPSDYGQLAVRPNQAPQKIGVPTLKATAQPGIASPQEAQLSAPLALPGVYSPGVEQGMQKATTAGGGAKFQQDEHGWMLNPGNPDNAYEKRTSPENQAQDEQRIAESTGRDPGQRLRELFHPGQAASATLARNVSLPGADQTRGVMTPDPAKQLPAVGIPTPSQSAQAQQVGVAPGRPAVNWGNPTAMFNEAQRDIKSRLHQAHQSGDSAGLAKILGEWDAFQKGGYGGRATYNAEQSRFSAENNHLNMLPSGAYSAAGKGGALVNPDGTIDTARALQNGLDQTNDIAGGYAAKQQAEIHNYMTQEAKGQRVQIRPENAEAILTSQFPQLQRYFANDQGTPKIGIAEALEGLNAQKPEFFQDPGSVGAQAAGAFLRQLYGAELPTQLALPANPHAISPDSSQSYGGRVLGQTGARLANLWNWDGPVLGNPATAYDKAANANALFNKLTNQPAKQ